MVSSLTRIISVIALLDWQQFNVFISLQCEQGEGRRRGMKGVGAGRCQKTFFFKPILAHTRWLPLRILPVTRGTAGNVGARERNLTGVPP